MQQFLGEFGRVVVCKTSKGTGKRGARMYTLERYQEMYGPGSKKRNKEESAHESSSGVSSAVGVVD